ncbi:hypothetical protein IW150_006171 [Coemansia sp. RSA 2607]|nr:hypothetical protein IW150_006171 [Coemansia sp. RSA 2607]
MLLSDTRFAAKTFANLFCSFLKRATSGVFRRAQQNANNSDNTPLPAPSVNPKRKSFYYIPDMFAVADVYTFGTGQGMLQLFGVQSLMRSSISSFIGQVVMECGYNPDCLVTAMQILDRFLTNTTATRVKERTYHYAFVSLMIAVEEVHGCSMSIKQFKSYVDRHCSNRAVKKYKMQVLKTLDGVVSVPTTVDLLLAMLQTAAYQYPTAFAADDKIERVEEIRRKGLAFDTEPFLFDRELFFKACKLAVLATCDQKCQRYEESALASACFYILVEEMPNVDMDKASMSARHLYKYVAEISDHIKSIV